MPTATLESYLWYWKWVWRYVRATSIRQLPAIISQWLHLYDSFSRTWRASNLRCLRTTRSLCPVSFSTSASHPREWETAVVRPGSHVSAHRIPPLRLSYSSLNVCISSVLVSRRWKKTWWTRPVSWTWLLRSGLSLSTVWSPMNQPREQPTTAAAFLPGRNEWVDLRLLAVCHTAPYKTPVP